MNSIKVWGAGTPWKTQSAFFNYIRGGIRKGLWMRHPIKLQFLKDNRKRVPLGSITNKNPEGMVWGCECNICKNDFRQTDVQVDHKKGNTRLKTEEDLKNFILAMAFVTQEDLQIVCHECHKIKNYQERMGITFEEASAEKKAIEIVKQKKDKEFILSKGGQPDTNEKGRRKQVVSIILEELSKT